LFHSRIAFSSRAAFVLSRVILFTFLSTFKGFLSNIKVEYQGFSVSQAESFDPRAKSTCLDGRSLIRTRLQRYKVSMYENDFNGNVVALTRSCLLDRFILC